MNTNFVTIYIWLIIYSFFGWVYESTLCSITGRKLVNRGFLNGPLCPIYGFGAIATIFCLQSSADGNVFVLFLAGAVVTCTLEYITSWGMEKLFQTRWWDYSHHRFQINGRICLLGALAFGFMSVILLKFVHPMVAALVAHVPMLWQNIFFIGTVIPIIGDIFVTTKSILSLNNKLQEIQNAINLEKAKREQRLERLKTAIEARSAELKELREEYGFIMALPLSEQKEIFAKKFESSEFYSERINHLLSQRKYGEQRLLKAFPRMQSVKSGDALSSLKSKLKRR